jgi:hypothetical protein
VSAPRLLRILTLLAADGPAVSLRGLCTVAARVVDVAGAGVVLDDPVHRQPLCSSDAVTFRILDLCLTLGEGPGLDAHLGGLPVAEPDLAFPSRARWPSFSPPALSAGAVALFAFPLHVGAVRIGSLTFRRARPGALSDDQYADALTMSSVVVHAVLADQAGAPPGALASELTALTNSRAEVHQACGMVSVQLAVSLSEASVRLRAHAYVEGRPLAEVARDVVGRRLRLSR